MMFLRSYRANNSGALDEFIGPGDIHVNRRVADLKFLRSITRSWSRCRRSYWLSFEYQRFRTRRIYWRKRCWINSEEWTNLVERDWPHALDLSPVHRQT